jgi:hypothetical protein
LNFLNRISVSTSTTADMVKRKSEEVKTDPVELIKLVEKSLEALEVSSKAAIEAAVGIKNLKERVYERLNMNSEGEC